MDPFLAGLLWSTLTLLLAASGAVLVWDARSRARVGRVLSAERPRRRARLLFLAGLAAAAVLVLLGREQVALAPTLGVLALSAVLLALSPGFLDSACGEDGVRRGWHARRYEDLEEWRLIGDHLRWKLRGEWLASRLPAERQAELREKLAKLCPDRESRFGR